MSKLEYGDPWVLAIPTVKAGLPEKFTEWRGHQAQAIVDVLASEERFKAVDAPVGMGKSIIGVAVANLERKRMVYLTSTKELQHQLLRDAFPGLTLVKGRNNFVCKDPVAGGQYSCEEFGNWCEARKCLYKRRFGREGVPGHAAACNPYDCDGWAGDCDYKEQYQTALHSELIVTNYSYWLALNKHSQDANPLGPVDLLVCDEAHNAPDEVCRAMSVVITVGDLGLLRKVQAPKQTRDPEAWKDWAELAIRDMAANPVGWDMRTQGKPPKSIQRLMKRRENLALKLASLKRLYGDWVASQSQVGRTHGWVIEPVWAGQHAEGALFNGIPNVLMMSGTFTRKTAALLGVSIADYELFRYPYVFPRKANPIYHLKCAVINKHTKPEGIEIWLRTIFNIVIKRRDRKGLIHSVSYQRAEEIAAYIREKDERLGRLVITHDRREAREAVAKFKAADYPCVLISPAVTTGYDFPYEQCEYIIQSKLPFPVMKTAVNEYRANQDRSYAGYVMMQELVQSCGRGMRAADDRCEVFITDDSWFWVSKRYGGMAPAYFKVGTVDYVPRTPMRLSEWREKKGQFEEVYS